MGDVFGRPGRKAVSQYLRELKAKHLVDVCIINGENAAHGKGITHEIAKQFFLLGADVITLGNHAWDNKDIFNFIHTEERLIRPYNFPPGLPGKGYVKFHLRNGQKVTVAQLCCRLFMTPIDCPFVGADKMIEEANQTAWEMRVASTEYARQRLSDIENNLTEMLVKVQKNKKELK